MTKIVYGCDPDSKAHGISRWVDGKLADVVCLTLVELIGALEIEVETYGADSIEFNIEDVNATSAAFNARDRKTNINVKLKMAQHIGQCKQSQLEVERVVESFGIKIYRHKISKMWKSQNGKSQFEKVTGWNKRSNEDSRSASYFGWLGVTRGNR